MGRRLQVRWALAGLALVAGGILAPVASADRLPIPGSHLYYEVHGRGTPVVLIHGGNLDSGMWDSDVPVLAKTFRVITYDVRPYGRSGPVTDDYAWHEDLRALLDHLKIPRADLVGLSLGARLAINFALAYPSRVDRLVLAGPGLDGYNWTPDPLMAGLVAAVKARDAAKATALWLEHPYMATGMRDPTRAVVLRRLAERNQHIWLQPVGPRVVPEPPAATRLAEITAPTLVIVGTLDVPDILGIADRLTAEVRGARKVVLPDVGHLINLEAPERFRARVTDFLRRR